MLDMFFGLLAQWPAIWFAGAGGLAAAYAAYASGCIMLCAPVYVAWAAYLFFAEKADKRLSRVVGKVALFNAALIACPCLAPLAVAYGACWLAYRALRWYAAEQRRQQARRRPAQPRP